MLLLLGALACAGEGSAHAQPPPDASARASELSRRAKDAYDKGRFSDAADLLTQAYSLDPSPTLLYNIARCHELASHSCVAWLTYKRYLQEPKVEGRAAIEATIARLDAEGHCSNPAPAPAPTPTPAPTVTPPPPAKKPPPEPPKCGGPGRPCPRETPPSAPASSGGTRVWPIVGWAAVGTGLAGLALGGFFGVRANTTHSDAGAEPDALVAEQKQHRAESLATAANVSFIVGGAVAAIGVVVLLLDPDHPAPQPAGER